MMPVKYKYELSNDNKSVYSTGSTEFSTSGDSDANTTAEWRVHIQNIEIMYIRKTQYKSLDGTADFNYLDCNFTIDVSREHIYLNASSGDMLQYQQLDLITDSSTGGMGLSGVIRTRVAGVTRRVVRVGDVESRTRGNSNVIAGRNPGNYLAEFDVSANTNSTVLDMVVAAKGAAPGFEINLVDL